MPRVNTLCSNRVELISDLQHSGLSFKKLGEKYGVTRQGIHCFYVRNKEEIGERFKAKPIPKPTPPPHAFTRCKICQQIITIGREEWSYLTWSLGMIGREVGLSDRKEIRTHLTALKKVRRIPLDLGRISSDKKALAYRVYLTEDLPVKKIGKMFGLKNFFSLIAQNRKRGLKVPDPHFKWNTEARRKAAKAIHERKRRIKDRTAAQLSSKEKRKD
jgi:hypothetical protein